MAVSDMGCLFRTVRPGVGQDFILAPYELLGQCSVVAEREVFRGPMSKMSVAVRRTCDKQAGPIKWE
ncbi:hypothetical protein GCM10027572_31830 [Flexivirga lutea]